ncbi:MAG: EamA family transporter RarD, partial [Pseudomonadota bacterium]|nr:EamA family transporter RarD [Pseudomonadota bacterium]
MNAATGLTGETRKGIYFALGAYGIWGFAPIYFVWVSFAQPLEVLAHRVVWGVPFLGLLLLATGQWRDIAEHSRRAIGYLLVSALFLSINWLTFIYAIQTERIAEASLGYFINPLVNILLGWLFLRERLGRLQWLAVSLAAIGVGSELIARASLPWLGLTLAFSFGLYGLLRKQVNVPAVVGLSIETIMLTPLAVGFLVWLGVNDGIREFNDILSLGLGGLVTVVPLVCFAAAAIRLPLSTLGFIQYLAPTCTLLLALFV